MGQKVNPISLRLGIIRGWDSNWYGGRDYSDKIVEEKTNGDIKVEIYPNNQLGESRSVLEGIQLGTVQMAQVTGPMLSFVPELVVFELPFLFRDRDHMYAVMDSEIGKSLNPSFEKRGFHSLGYGDVGLRHILTVDKQINSIEDLKGLKIRTMGNPAHLAAFKAFGANPLPMAYGELYTALEQKVIDGAELNGLNGILAVSSYKYRLKINRL